MLVLSLWVLMVVLAVLGVLGCAGVCWVLTAAGCLPLKMLRRHAPAAAQCGCTVARREWVTPVAQCASPASQPSGAAGQRVSGGRRTSQRRRSALGKLAVDKSRQDLPAVLLRAARQA